MEWRTESTLQNELLPTFGVKEIPKILPVGLVLLLVLVPKTEPRMTAAKTRIVDKQIGMMNLFLRYQGRLGNVTKVSIKITIRKRCG
jgi:hypothetical protein